MERLRRTRGGLRTAVAEWRAFGHPRHRVFLRIGVSSAVVAALVGDGLTVPLLLTLGAHPAVATLIGVLPVAFSAAQLRVPWLLDKSDGDLRRVTLLILAAGELRGFILAVVTFLAWTGGLPTVAAVVAIAIVMSLGGAATTIGGTNLLAWYGAILPDAERRFVAPRVMGLTIGLGAVLLLPVALVVQAGLGTFGVLIYAGIFALGGLGGLVELAVVRHLPHPGRVRVARTGPAGVTAAAAAATAASAPGLEGFIRSITFAAFGAGLGPYLSIYSISVLHLTPGFAILLSALWSGSALVASTVIGGLLMRGSSSRTLRLSFVLRGGSMLLGLLALPGQPSAGLVICLVAIVASAGAAAGTLAANERLLRLTFGTGGLMAAQGRFVAGNALGMTAGQAANAAVLALAPLSYVTFAGLFLVSGFTRFIVASRAEVSAGWGTATTVYRVDDLKGPPVPPPSA
jgi:hypothetical protein